MNLFWKKKEYSVNYDVLLSSLQSGEEKYLTNLLWQPKHTKIDYLPITIDYLLKLKKPAGSVSNLSIFQTQQKGKYELLIFELPWEESRTQYSPLLIDRSNSRIVGIMLVFNELAGIISKKDNRHLGELGNIWMSFIIPLNFA